MEPCAPPAEARTHPTTERDFVSARERLPWALPLRIQAPLRGRR